MYDKDSLLLALYVFKKNISTKDVRHITSFLLSGQLSFDGLNAAYISEEKYKSFETIHHRNLVERRQL